MDQNQNEENPETNQQLKKWLQEHNIPFQETYHEATKTSEDSAKIRGATLASGAKAMLLYKKSKKETQLEDYILAVMSAERKISWKSIRKLISKQLDLANQDQVYQITKCLPGGVPPFGSLFGIQTVLDKSLITQGEDINFNAGLRTNSFNMKVDDYLKIEKPQIMEFTDVVN